MISHEAVAYRCMIPLLPPYDPCTFGLSCLGRFLFIPAGTTKNAGASKAPIKDIVCATKKPAVVKKINCCKLTFILDDFATNCKITDFPRMISSIRSRGLSTMLILQSEAQLQNCYGPDGRTVVANCDSYVYLGGNDLETAEAISRRCDLPLGKILYMPVGTNWIFRRGQKPVNGRNFVLEPFEQMLLKRGLDDKIR